MSQTLLRRVVASAAVTCVAGPAVRRAMLASGVLDVPNHRSSHSTPIPRGGGIACLLGVAAGAALTPHVLPTRDLVAIGGLAAVGLLDDHRGGVSPHVRLVAQSGAGLVCGLRHDPISAAVGSVLVPGVVNVVNFMDGINGISGSTAAVWGGLAASDPRATAAARALGAVTAGAGIGFLPHNVPQARLFLGDVGSYLLGALMSVALVESVRRPRTALRLGAPLLPYAADAAQAIYRRHRRGEPLLEAHRQHVYQRIVDDHGVSHTAMAGAHAATAAAVGLLVRSHRSAVAVAGPLAVLGAYVSSPALLRRWPQRRLS